MTFYPIIGLEIHVQLNTKTKLFCRCLNEYTPDEPNKNICPFCTGQPGALPSLNRAAVEKALQLGVALNAKIPAKTRWDRKNYFYPDLPAGYQISQYDNPIVEGGQLEFFVENKDTGDFTPFKVNLVRAHLEADAGKLLHLEDKSLVDYNRSGAPLIEIVTQPEIRNANQAVGFVSELQTLVRYLKISDANLDKGQMRFDCNLSLQTESQKKQGILPSYKVEIKNLNSFRSLNRAIEYEITRQSKILTKGETPVQETRGWRDDLNKSVAQRSKEMAHDYRYFPEPDLRILEIEPSDIPTKNSLPVLPQDRRKKYLDLKISIQTANTFVSQPLVGDYFDSGLSLLENDSGLEPDLKVKTQQSLANTITVNLLGLAEKTERNLLDIIDISQLLVLVKNFSEQKISNQGLAKALEIAVDEEEVDILKILKENELLQISDDAILISFVEAVIENNPKPVKEYQDGKVQVVGFLIGQCMKESKGKGNPAKFKMLLEKKLAETKN